MQTTRILIFFLFFFSLRCSLPENNRKICTSSAPTCVASPPAPMPTKRKFPQLFYPSYHPQHKLRNCAQHSFPKNEEGKLDSPALRTIPQWLSVSSYYHTSPYRAKRSAPHSRAGGAASVLLASLSFFPTSILPLCRRSFRRSAITPNALARSRKPSLMQICARFYLLAFSYSSRFAPALSPPFLLRRSRRCIMRHVLRGGRAS